MVLASTVLPSGTLGQAYSQTLSSSGGVGGYAYSTTSKLPAGLTLSGGGVISGVPTVRTSVSVAVVVVDSAGRVGSVVPAQDRLAGMAVVLPGLDRVECPTQLKRG